MSDDLDWEVRHPSTPFYVHLAAGSMAGISQHLFMLPFDNIKTHCQAGECMSIRQIATKIYRKGGLRSFYSGSTVLAAGCIPAHGLYFSIYQFMMEKMGLNMHSDNSGLLYTAVGFTSSLFHDLILTPTEAIKQRLQLYRSSGYQTGPIQVASTMLKNEGIRSFYKSYAINYFMNVPFGALIVTINEKLKQKFINQHSGLSNYFASAGLAGLLAAIPTCPLDVIKTRLNTQNCLNIKCGKDRIHCSVLKTSSPNYQNTLSAVHSYATLSEKLHQSAKGAERFIKYKNVTDAARKIYQQHGILGFFRGLKMRILIQCPSSAISWGTYEMFKRLLSKPTF